MADFNQEVYYSEAQVWQEELPMTFNLLAFALNGWVMASDRSQQNLVGNAVVRVRTSATVTKILYDESVGAACCFAGDDCAEYVADDIMAELRNGTFVRDQRKQEFERISNARCRSEAVRLGQDWQPRAARTVLLMLCDRQAGWMIHVGERTFARELNPYGSVYIGDIANPAVFFPERYYPAYSTQLRRASELVFPMAHSVLEAHALNSSGIYGLDVLAYENGQFHWYSDAELKDLETRSKKLADMVRTAIFQ